MTYTEDYDEDQACSNKRQKGHNSIGGIGIDDENVKLASGIRRRGEVLSYRHASYAVRTVQISPLLSSCRKRRSA